MMDDLDMTQGTAESDLQEMLDYFPLEDLGRLGEAIAADRLIKRSYTDDEGRGCLMYFLANVTSKQQILEYDFGFGGEELWLAARRLIRHWDLGHLPLRDLRAAVLRAISQRTRVNQLEQRAIRRSRARMKV